MKYRLFYVFLAVCILLAGCKGGTPAPASEEEQVEESAETNENPTMNEPSNVSADKWAGLGDEPLLKIKTTDGTMTVKLYSVTPLHRDNFVKLAKSGFYNGLLFHRVIKGFMIQGGDPFTRDSTKVAQFGTGGPGYTIPAEIVPGLTHKKGALAAARRGDMVNPAKESSGSQFYIVHDPDNCVHLDGEYTIFGEVVEGLDVIDKLASERTDFRDRPVKDVQIISITPAN
jgi:cyclophilin family peptidyl-prolyl cis-trans isomerase